MTVWSSYNADVAISQSNIDTGTVVVDSFDDIDGKGAVWHYVIDKGSGANRRVGKFGAVWDVVSGSSPVMLPDEFSDDIGSTLGHVTFSIDKSASTVRVKMTVDSDDWSFFAVRTLIGS